MSLSSCCAMGWEGAGLAAEHLGMAILSPLCPLEKAWAETWFVL